MNPPKSVQLPGGRVIELRPKGDVAPRKPDSAHVRFANVLKLFANDVDLLVGGERIDPESLLLAELHALRAIAAHVGWLEEEEVEIDCRNCEDVIRARPCASMPLAPFVDAELSDPELDVLLDTEREHDVEALGMTIRFAKLTARDSLPLHRALRKTDLVLTPPVVKAMGIAALGKETDAAAIAMVLTNCDDRAFGAITNLFLEAHYPLRLFAPVMCPKCGSRNDVDAPFDREFEVYEDVPKSTANAFLSFDEFDAMTHRIAEPLIASAHGPPHDGGLSPPLTLVVEGGVPACDDGGEPLLGAYVPGNADEARAPEITVYYKTFASMWKDGTYDIEDEVRETIEHELEHHTASLVGHDPKDDEEQSEIAHEAARVLGKKELARASARGLFTDVREFWARTWLVWFVALIAAIAVVLASRQ